MVVIEGAALTVRVNCLEVLPKALVAARVRVAVPGAVGVPPITPTTVFISIPAGSAPLVIAQVIGAGPETASVCKYGAPTKATGNGEVVTIEGGPLTVRLSCLELLPNALVARTIREVAPGVAGVPLRDPVDLFNVSPAGTGPFVTLHVIGVLPEAVRI